VDEDGGLSEGEFERVEGGLLRRFPFERVLFSKESSERNDNVREGRDKSTIKVRKTEEGLNILNRLRRRPIGDSFRFRRVHGDALRRDDEAEEFDGGRVEDRLLGFDMEVVFAKTGEHLVNVFAMSFDVVREDENVVEIDEDEEVGHVAEDVVHKEL